jgi:beta-phosphoglucomutase-like phosphatase (HAD superfamily)
MHELVIFDCDGVLVDSEVISNEVLARMLTREGLPTTLLEARRDYQGLLLADVRTRAEAKLGRLLPPAWLVEYVNERAETFQRELKPVAGAAETVQRVKDAGLKVCVASQAALELCRASGYVAVGIEDRCISVIWFCFASDEGASCEARRTVVARRGCCVKGWRPACL